MKKRLYIFALILAMVFTFTACGGGGSSGSGNGGGEAAPEAPAAEPNAGTAGIVYTIPDGWAVSNQASADYSEYTIPNSDVVFSVSAIGQETLDEFFVEDPITLQEYYDQFDLTEQEYEEQNIEHSTFTLCGTEAFLNKYKSSSGACAMYETSMIYNDKVYWIALLDPDAFGDDGLIKEDAKPLSDDLIAEYEAVIASIQPGDGAAFYKEVALSADTLGSIGFTTPEGFKITHIDDEYIQMEKGDVMIGFSLVTEEAFARWGVEYEGHPATQEEYFNQMLEYSDVTTIAGYDAYLEKYPEEDGNYYNLSAGFMGEEGEYEIYMDTDAYDENGLKPDAVPLTEEDVAAFDSFLDSLTQK